jgi:hypothetical protein
MNFKLKTDEQLTRQRFQEKLNQDFARNMIQELSGKDGGQIIELDQGEESPLPKQF